MENSKRLLRFIRMGFITAVKEGFPAVIMGVILCICFDTWDQIPFLWTASESVDVFYYWFNAFSFGGFYSVFVITMLACIPYAASFCEEYNSNILRTLLSKTNTKEYCMAKSFVTAISGGLSLAFGGSVFVCMAAFFTELVNRNRLSEYNGLPYYKYLQEGNGIKYFLAVIFLLYLAGMLWSSIALLASAYIQNRYVVFVAPFIVSFFLVRVNSLLNLPSYMCLNLLLQGRSIIGTEEKTLLITAIIILLLVCFLHFLFYRKVERIVGNE